jgi:transcriptional regulator with XRE-family HTH domain
LDKELFGLNVRYFRKKMKLTNEKLAKRIYLSPGWVSKLENNGHQDEILNFTKKPGRSLASGRTDELSIKPATTLRTPTLSLEDMSAAADDQTRLRQLLENHQGCT